MKNLKGGIALLVVAMVCVGWSTTAVADDDRPAWPPMPGVALKVGGGLYHSVPCGCVDRGLWNVALAGRLHFGEIAAVEATLQRGSMLLGGKFPSSAFSTAARVSVLPQRGRWWDGLSAGLGYRRWSVMGMRSPGAHGAFAVVNWAVEVFPHVELEAETVGGRAFEVMPHWHLEGKLGLALRF